MGSLLGKGGSSSTEVTIPDWLQDSLQPLLEGSADKYGDWQDALYDLAMYEDPETGLPRILSDQSRGTAGMDYWENRAGELAGTLTGGSPQYGKANSIYDNLQNMNGLENRANYLAQVYADPRNSPYEHKRSKQMLNELAGTASGPVDFSGYESDPLFAQQMQAWEANVDPKITNAATSMGLGRSGAAAAAKGLSKTNAVRDAMQDYIGQKNINRQAKMSGLSTGASGMRGLSQDIRGARSQNLQTKLGLGGALRGSRHAAAEGYTGIGDRMHNRKLDAINALSEMGQRRRGVNQDRLDADWEERMRKIAAFESALGGPMGMIPGMTGAITSQQKKNK